MSNKVFVGQGVSAAEFSPAFLPYTRVTLWIDGETFVTAGDDSGRTLEADLPWATQAIAESVLASVAGFVYQPFTGTDALIHPAVELGDGVTVNGMYGPLAVAETIFDALFTADISAPHDEEIDHEYPYVSPQAREIARKVSLGKSYYGTRITRANGLEITKTEADGTERSRVKLNSDVLAFYNDDGLEALYFDTASGKYRFRGDVQITGGTMNVNNNFIVDAQGNLTINGNIDLSNGKISWGGNYPSSGGISAAQAQNIASTVVTSALVASPTIAGATFVGGTYYGTDFNVVSENGTYGSLNITVNGSKLMYINANPLASYAPLVSFGSSGDAEAEWKFPQTYFDGDYYFSGGDIAFESDCTISFNGATVTGLNVVFG